MRLLLDTHMVFWAVMAPSRLPDIAVTLLESAENDAAVSVASAWEIALKVGIGKWPEAEDLIEHFEKVMDDSGFDILPLTVAQVRAAGLMQVPHRDPFDRLLAAQASDLGLTMLTVDRAFGSLGCQLVSQLSLD